MAVSSPNAQLYRRRPFPPVMEAADVAERRDEIGPVMHQGAEHPARFEGRQLERVADE